MKNRVSEDRHVDDLLDHHIVFFSYGKYLSSIFHVFTTARRRDLS